MDESSSVGKHRAVSVSIACVAVGIAVYLYPQALWSLPNEKTEGFPQGHMQAFGHHLTEWPDAVRLDTPPDPATFYRDYMRPGIPLVLKGAANDWVATTRWKDQDYVKEKFGHSYMQVAIKDEIDGKHKYHTFMTINDYIEMYESAKVYMDSSITKEMVKDLKWPSFMDHEVFFNNIKQMALFFNSGKSSTDIHIDTVETFFIQVTGRRRWLLSPPESVPGLYTEHFPYHSGISPINVDRVDMNQFPNVTSVKVYNISTEPGDIVYVPEGWFHQVRAFDSPNMAVSIFMHYSYCFEKVRNVDMTDTQYVEKCLEMKAEMPAEISQTKEQYSDIPLEEIFAKYKNNAVFWSDELNDTNIHESPKKRKKMKDGNEVPVMGFKVPETGPVQEVIRKAVHVGYRMAYVNHNSSSDLGTFLKTSSLKMDNNLYITAKVYADRVQQDVDKILNNLNRESIDLVLLEIPKCTDCKGVGRQLVDAWRKLEEYHRQGKIKSLGVSLLSLEEVKILGKVAKVPISVVEHYLTPLQLNEDLRTYCSDNDITFLVIGHYRRHSPSDTNKKHPIHDNFTFYMLQCKFHIPVSGLLLHWVMSKGAIVAPMSTNPHHVFLNWQAHFLDMSDAPELFAQIDTIFT